jgi:hypothetical protein
MLCSSSNSKLPTALINKLVLLVVMINRCIIAMTNAVGMLNKWGSIHWRTPLVCEWGSGPPDPPGSPPMETVRHAFLQCPIEFLQMGKALKQRHISRAMTGCRKSAAICPTRRPTACACMHRTTLSCSCWSSGDRVGHRRIRLDKLADALVNLLQRDRPEGV